MEKKSEHLELSGFIKEVHRNLRREYKLAKRENKDDVWTEHCQNKVLLSRYAKAMHSLATQIWTSNPQTRIDWCHVTVQNYFNSTDGDLVKLRIKDLRRKEFYLKSISPEKDRTNKLLLDIDDEIKLPLENPIHLLDVGSCYDAFKDYNHGQNTSNQYLTVAIDLYPATETVFKCDFLRLNIVDSDTVSSGKQFDNSQISVQINNNNNNENINISKNNKSFTELNNFLKSSRDSLNCLPSKTFHVVIFSLLLDYLPCPKQRFSCCLKASHLLNHDGLMIIIMPDSKNQNRNFSLIRNWTETIVSHLPFVKYKYQKLQHLHCLAFRKHSQQAEIIRSLKMAQNKITVQLKGLQSNVNSLLKRPHTQILISNNGCQTDDDDCIASDAKEACLNVETTKNKKDILKSSFKNVSNHERIIKNHINNNCLTKDGSNDELPTGNLINKLKNSLISGMNQNTLKETNTGADNIENNKNKNISDNRDTNLISTYVIEDSIITNEDSVKESKPVERLDDLSIKGMMSFIQILHLDSLPELRIVQDDKILDINSDSDNEDNTD